MIDGKADKNKITDRNLPFKLILSKNRREKLLGMIESVFAQRDQKTTRPVDHELIASYMRIIGKIKGEK